MHTVTFAHRFLLFGSKLEFPWDCGTIQSHAKTLPCARSLSQHGKFPATLLLKFFVLYYKRNIKHFFRIDIQLYQHEWKLQKREIV